MAQLAKLLEDTREMRYRTLPKVKSIIVRYHWYEDVKEMRKKGVVSSFFQKAKTFLTGSHKGKEEHAEYVGEVRIEGRIHAYDRKNWVHDVVIVIPNKFAFSEEGRQHYPVEILKDTKRKEYYVGILLPEDQVQVRCSCEDYYYTWWYWNKQNGSHYGPDMPRYIRKTPPPPKGRPSRNPKKLPGFCKHIMAMIDETVVYSINAQIQFNRGSKLITHGGESKATNSKQTNIKPAQNSIFNKIGTKIKGLWK